MFIEVKKREKRKGGKKRKKSKEGDNAKRGPLIGYFPLRREEEVTLNFPHFREEI